MEQIQVKECQNVTVHRQ